MFVSNLHTSTLLQFYFSCLDFPFVSASSFSANLFFADILHYLYSHAAIFLFCFVLFCIIVTETVFWTGLFLVVPLLVPD